MQSCTGTLQESSLITATPCVVGSQNSTCTLTQFASRSCVFDTCYSNTLSTVGSTYGRSAAAAAAPTTTAAAAVRRVCSASSSLHRTYGAACWQLPICKLSKASMRWPTHQPELLLAQYQAQLHSFYFPRAVVFNLCAFWHAVPSAKLQEQYGVVSTQHCFGSHQVNFELFDSIF